MNDKVRNIIGKIFEKLYYYLVLSLGFLVTFILGLGIFSFAGSHIMAYKVYQKLESERYKEKVKVGRLYKENAVEIVISHVKLSLAYALLIIILAVDMFYFSTSVTVIHTGLFYLSLILTFVIINAMLVSFFIKATYKEMELKELLQNSVALVVVNIIDILFLDICLGIIAYFLGKLSLILVLLLLPGIYIELTYNAYKRLIEKRSITNLLFNIKN